MAASNSSKVTKDDLSLVMIDDEVIELTDDDLSIPDHVKLQTAAQRWIEAVTSYNNSMELAQMNSKFNPEACERYLKQAGEQKKLLAGYKKKYGPELIQEARREMEVNEHIRKLRLKELGLG